VVGGGFAPLIASALQTATGASWPVSAYMLVVGLISLGAVLLLREATAWTVCPNGRRPLRERDPSASTGRKASSQKYSAGLAPAMTAIGI